MNATFKRWVGPVAATLLLAAPGLAAAQTLQGHIISHDGDKLVLRVGAGDTAVMLTPSTQIQAITGLLGGQREDHPPTDLIRGLAVTVETVQNGAELDAAKITFKPADLKTARAIAAGIEQPRQRIAAAQAENERRLSLVGQFTEKGSVRVYFDTGSATLSERGKRDLQSFAQQAMATPGAVVRVVGHTDSTGSAAANQRLSGQRASTVTAYLVRTLGISPEKIMSPAALGSTVTAQEDIGSPNNAESRRVTVSILVSKAAEQASSAPQP